MDIQTWLQNCTAANVHSGSNGKRESKGSHSHSHHLPTPPPMDRDHHNKNETPRPRSPNKRRRQDEAHTSTPTRSSRPSASRATSSIVSDAPSLGPSFAISKARSSPTRKTNTNTESIVSGRSSPQKQFASLALQPDDGIVRKELNVLDPALPGPLVSLLKDIGNLAAGTGAISLSAKNV
jgi:hypothetical protein